MAKDVDLDELMEYIGTRWTFTATKHPKAAGLNGPQTLSFIMKEIVRDVGATIRKLMIEIKSVDQGGSFVQQHLRIAAAQLVVCGLKLAHQLQMTPEQLADLAEIEIRLKQ